MDDADVARRLERREALGGKEDAARAGGEEDTSDGGEPIAKVAHVLRRRAEARAPRDLVRVVRIVRLAELDAISLRHDGPQHAVQMRVLERTPSLHAEHLAVQADDRRLTAAKMQIGRTSLDGRAQELLDCRASILAAFEIVYVVE